MTIEDEARAEARKKFRDDPDSDSMSLGEAFEEGFLEAVRWMTSRQPSEAKSYLNGDRDDEVDAEQIAMHEYTFGPEEPLTERDKSITRQAWRAALEAARTARGEQK